MVIVLAVLLSVAALLAVAYPIIAGAREAKVALTSAQETLEELLARRDAAFQALRDLNFDHRVGKITGEDFTMFEANLKQVAADALRVLDEWEKGADQALDQVIEQQVSARRAALSSAGRSCPQCGRPAAPEDKFCASCGTPLPVASAAPRTCPTCGRPFEPGDRFCAGCGQPLS
jgi:hypothetical protein